MIPCTMDPLAPILDVRPEARFLAAHAPGAASIPLEEIARRSHELPPKGSTVRLFDEDPGRTRATAGTCSGADTRSRLQPYPRRN